METLLSEETLLSDPVLWATCLFLVVGGVAGVAIVVVSLWGRPGGRLPPAAARATNQSIFTMAVVAYVGAYLLGVLVAGID
jgi:hypothetical protein